MLAKFNNDLKNRMNNKPLTSSAVSVKDKENTCPAPTASYYGSAVKSSLKNDEGLTQSVMGKKLAWEDLSTNSRGRQSFGKVGNERPISAAFKES